MRSAGAVIGTAIFLVFVPCVLAGVVPWWISRWEFLPPFFDVQATRAVGMLLIVAGLAGLVDSFARFALQGLGTPAPIAPPTNLVVTGLYRHVRNPMYVTVLALLLGQALLLGNIVLLVYAAIVWLGFTLFVMIYEEPTLRSTFGESYALYCRNVPRWLPRVKPWTP